MLLKIYIFFLFSWESTVLLSNIFKIHDAKKTLMYEFEIAVVTKGI